MVAIFATFVGGVVFISSQTIQDYVIETEKSFVKAFELVGKGLKSSGPVDTPLTKTGIFYWTNHHRSEAGVSKKLVLNETLSEIARLRAEDMFLDQYFEHIAPDGESASVLAEKVGYEAIGIAENIALGGFEDDKDLVIAWMESPGHRANIVKPSFSEIGISAIKGFFEGREVWIAVQIFGRPMSECKHFEPNPALLKKIDGLEDKRADLDSDLQEALEDIENISKSNRSRYNEKVTHYNSLVAKMRLLVDDLNEARENYSEQVGAYNLCLRGQ